MSNIVVDVLTLSSKDIVRFWSKVDIRGEDECWEWQRSKDSWGYGHGRFKGQLWKAHSLVYTLIYGVIPAGLLVCHTCDNPPCCNPKHLFLGTNAGNNADKAAKGRTLRGEQNNNHKLTWVAVYNIRQRYTQGNVSQRALAKEFGICHRTLWKVVNNKNWNRGDPHG